MAVEVGAKGPYRVRLSRANIWTLDAVCLTGPCPPAKWPRMQIAAGAFAIEQDTHCAQSLLAREKQLRQVLQLTMAALRSPSVNAAQPRVSSAERSTFSRIIMSWMRAP